MRRGGRKLLAAAGAAVLALATAGCGGSGGSGDGGSGGKPTLTLYNAQHEDLMKLMVDGFTKETGIKVRMRSGEDPEMANQIVQEGPASPADVFVTENSPAMTLVDGKNLFTKVSAGTIAQVPAAYRPADSDWVGFAARSTVLAYNSKQLTAPGLPASIMDLAAPQWKGEVGVAAAGADFQAIVSAVLALKGEAATAGWLKGLKANAKVYDGNSAVMKAVNAGEIQTGLVYHYYWYQDRAESGANSKNVELHFFGHKDPGAFVGVSGAGVLKSSKHQAEAQQLVQYLTGQNGQQILARSSALEYSVSAQVPTNPKLKPLSQLGAPDVDIAGLNGPKVVALMQQAGLL
ncbi:MAG: extracellular solute-binding protein family 1 [Streptosporangiaceae bacterium]|nr:extracellular solute-binding protein family 1 [Streptosporangiaceae bacterium]